MAKPKYPAWLGRFGHGPSEMKHTYYGYSNLIVDFYIDDLEKMVKAYGDAADSMEYELRNRILDAAYTISGIMRYSLQKTWSGSYRVSASGTAADNIEVMDVGSYDKPDAQIWEGEKTIANTIIRRGLRPGTLIPKPILLKWLKDKNITLKEYDAVDNQMVSSLANTQRLHTNYFTTPGYTTHRGRTVRPAMYLKSRGKKKISGKYKVREGILTAIRQKIFKEGASDYWSIPGTGDRKFDYVRWSLDRKSEYMPSVQQALESPVRVAMAVINSNKAADRPNVYSRRRITKTSRWR